MIATDLDTCEHGTELSGSIKGGQLFYYLSD
jgi:hypothetical protein